MRFLTLAIATLSFASVAPASAQDAMASQDQMAAHDHTAPAERMNAADMKAMKACNAMSHDAMMKNRRCAKLVAAHPGAMHHDAMGSDSMMSSGK